jgi:hypothetical protein
MSEEYTDEECAIIVRARSRLAYIDTLDEPQRSLAIAGVPESEWAERIQWIDATVAAIRGETRRVWRKDHWATEKAPTRSQGLIRSTNERNLPNG